MDLKMVKPKWAYFPKKVEYPFKNSCPA